MGNAPDRDTRCELSAFDCVGWDGVLVAARTKLRNVWSSAESQRKGEYPAQVRDNERSLNKTSPTIEGIRRCWRPRGADGHGDNYCGGFRSPPGKAPMKGKPPRVPLKAAQEHKNTEVPW